MNLEQAKFKISTILLELTKLLHYRNAEVMWDEELKKQAIFFNDWFTVEGFQNRIEFEIYLELDNLIHLCYLNELDENKRHLLVESIINSLNYETHINTYKYIETVDNLNAEQLIELKIFETEQERVQTWLVDKLTEKYLSEITFSKSKIARLIWKGTQLQLSELFSQLRNKNWIDTGKNHAAFYRTLATVFEVPGSNSLLENIKDYFNKKRISNYGLFKEIPPNDI